MQYHFIFCIGLFIVIVGMISGLFSNIFSSGSGFLSSNGFWSSNGYNASVLDFNSTEIEQYGGIGPGGNCTVLYYYIFCHG